jgi:predicted transposase/invertase (TIGR01784 family)
MGGECILKDVSNQKSILDIKAIDSIGNKFLIEMQASSQLHFPERALYYWSKLYSKSIGKGQDYTKLPKVYSFNFFSHDKHSREMYEARLKTEFDYKARLAFDIEQARLEGKIETAKQFLASGMSREQICKITGLKDSDF